MTKRVAGLAFACALALAAAGSGAAQVVVLSARGPTAKAYPPGSVLPAGRILKLEAGDQLEVLDEAGQRVITGPARVPAGRAGAKVEASLSSIFLKSRPSREGIAATRGFTLSPAPTADAGPSLWQIDVTDGGAVCAAPGQTPVLARGDGADPIRIVRLATGDARYLTWPAGARAADWPSALPVTDGERYSIGLDDGTAVPIIWRAVGSPARGLAALAQDLLDKDCYAQLDRLKAGARPAG